MKKLTYVLALSCIAISLNAAIVIGLGEMCTVAGATHTFSLRQAAYPFDWTIARFGTLYAVLEDDFNHFFEPHSLRVRADNKGVIDYYGAEFMHDLPTIADLLQANWQEFVPKAYEKYNRRIKRFKDAVTGTEKVYFVRHYGIDRSSAVQLRDLIRRKYATLDFTLVVVSSLQEFKKPWGLERIRNFYLDDSVIWNDGARWKTIFQSLGLIP
jgi:hypothetical protein